MELDECLEQDVLMQMKSERTPKSHFRCQLLVACIISVGCFVHGTSVVFPAVYLPSLLSDPSVSYLADSDVGLVVSVAAIGMLISSLLVGPIANWLGRKLSSVLGTGLVFLSSYLLVSGLLPLTNDKLLYSALLMGRFLMGVGLGFSTNLSTLYIMETAESERRASLAVLPALSGGVGVLFCQVCGALLTWHQLASSLAVLALITTLMFLTLPESPVHLLRHRPHQAEEVLKWLRGEEYDVQEELRQLRVALESSSEENSNTFRLMTLSQREYAMPLGLCLALMFFFQLSGISVVMQYTVSILQQAAPSLDAFTSTILIGLALFGSNVITLFVAHRLPRRLMLLISSSGVALCLLGLALHFKFNTDQQESDDVFRSWVPVILLMAYMPTFTLGYGSMIWITVTELLPLNIRPWSNGLCVAFTCLVSFVVTHTFPGMQKQIGIDNVLLIYAFVSGMGFVFILTLIPETKDKNEEEISKRYRRRSNQ